MEKNLNKLLIRQIKRHFGSADNLPDELKVFIQDINNTYENSEDDIKLLQNSIEISSQELRDAFQKHKNDADEQKKTINKIKEAIFALNSSDYNVYSDSETKSSDSSYLFESLIKLIEDSNQASKEVKRQAGLITSLLDSIPDIIFFKDTKGVYLGCNLPFAKSVNRSRDEIVGKTDYDLFDKKIADFFTKYDKRMIESLEAHNSEEWITYPDGQKLLIGTFKTPYWGKDGSLIGILGISRDITEQKRTEKIRSIQYNIARSILSAENLQQLLEIISKELSHIFNTSNFFVAMYNPETDMLKQVLYSDEHDAFTEWEASKSLSGLVVKQARTLLLNRKEVEQLEAEKNTTFIGSKAECWLGVPLIINDKATGVMVIQSYTNSEAYDQSSTALLEMIAHEIAVFIERRKMMDDMVVAKNKAEESDRLKSAFLANMSHEIRTPMNGILGFSGLLKEPNLSGEDQQKFIGIIEKSGIRMLNIINDIIDISKIESGLMDVSISETNINEQTEFIYSFFKTEIEEKGMRILLKNTLQTKDAIIKTDKEKIYAVLTNLVKNAVKFTSDGFIELGYEKKGDYIEFFVRDSGPGITEDKLQSIFERFRQGNESTNRKYEGAGLGLSISKAYIEMLGGKIWVESEINKGSVFYFTIPYTGAMQDNSVVKNIASAEERVSEMKKIKILIAEDDEISGMLLSLALKKISTEILKAKNGIEAVEICRRNPDIDLILMDIQMPEINGYEATKQIRQFNQNVVIIAQTAFALSGENEKSQAAGCNDCIAKPFNQVLLIDLIQKHFNS
jgi:PAS domain S-box-containing protein